MAVTEKRNDPAVLGLLAVTAAMIGLRLYASGIVGFGDSEALYACYALHPQAAYLDHPGLVGVLASALGNGFPPTPHAAHVATAALASMLPWLIVIVARTFGAETRAAAIAGLVVAAAPVMGIGLFAMTPDLLLAYTWIGFIGVAAMALESEPRGARAAAGFAIAGLIAGAAATAKVSGLALLPVLAIVAATDRNHRKTPWPWVGLGVGVVPLVPIARYEAATHFPMLRHRFIDTQHGAGFSLRNLGAVIGGQLLYLSPIIAVLAFIVARDLVRQMRTEEGRADSTTRLLFWTFALPIVPLLILCLWSRVAEPHWLAPPLLALPIHAARRGLAISRKLVAPAVALGFAMILAVHAWILSPSLLRYAPASYDAKVDIANELFGWQQAARTISEVTDEGDAAAGTRRDVWLVGPSWMVCAQLQASLPSMNVGCVTEVPSDFDDWSPRARWLRADAIIFVTDDRMPVDPQTLIPSFRIERSERVTVLRGGHIARTFRISVLEKRAAV